MSTYSQHISLQENVYHPEVNKFRGIKMFTNGTETREATLANSIDLRARLDLKEPSSIKQYGLKVCLA